LIDVNRKLKINGFAILHNDVKNHGSRGRECIDVASYETLGHVPLDFQLFNNLSGHSRSAKYLKFVSILCGLSRKEYTCTGL